MSVEDVFPATATPPIKKILFFVHGIGRQYGKYGNLEHSANTLQRSIDELLPTLFPKSDSQVEVIPIEWHSGLHKVVDDKISKSTLKTIPKVRLMTNDWMFDAGYYVTNYYGQVIVDTVVTKMNEAYARYIEEHPDFEVAGGEVSVIAFSLGGIVMYDILVNQDTDCIAGKFQLQIDKLNFKVRHLFTCGSPIAALIVMRGQYINDYLPPDYCTFHNIFHPYDPFGYRIETLIDESYCHIPPVVIERVQRKRILPKGVLPTLGLPSLTELGSTALAVKAKGLLSYGRLNARESFLFESLMRSTSTRFERANLDPVNNSTKASGDHNHLKRQSSADSLLLLSRGGKMRNRPAGVDLNLKINMTSQDECGKQGLYRHMHCSISVKASERQGIMKADDNQYPTLTTDEKDFGSGDYELDDGPMSLTIAQSVSSTPEGRLTNDGESEGELTVCNDPMPVHTSSATQGLSHQPFGGPKPEAVRNSLSLPNLQRVPNSSSRRLSESPLSESDANDPMLEGMSEREGVDDKAANIARSKRRLLEMAGSVAKAALSALSAVSGMSSENLGGETKRFPYQPPSCFTEEVEIGDAEPSTEVIDGMANNVNTFIPTARSASISDGNSEDAEESNATATNPDPIHPRIDHVLTETLLDNYASEWIVALKSHFRYWANRDVVLHMLRTWKKEQEKMEGEVHTPYETMKAQISRQELPEDELENESDDFYSPSEATLPEQIYGN
ncbi:uncharacterized protein VTP21DRAFT_10523 [Calcarisporiella thermophila]|uniref:uncharacterized protein n=1 Tax=Calcarisporiella thermophila TaxID=911321 RepID=UPI00374320F3